MEILLGGNRIGTARVERQGLYYFFDCRCRLSGEVLYRLTAECEGRREHLGIPVPEGEEFVLRTKIPVKRLGTGPIFLRAEPKREAVQGIFIPLSPEEPFRYLRRLQDGFLQTRDGRSGIVLRDMQELGMD